MNIEDIMVGKIMHKIVNTVRVHSYEIPRRIKLKETKNGMVTAKEKEELLFGGYRVSIWEDKTFCRWRVVIVFLKKWMEFPLWSSG